MEHRVPAVRHGKQIALDVVRLPGAIADGHALNAEAPVRRHDCSALDDLPAIPLARGSLTAPGVDDGRDRNSSRRQVPRRAPAVVARGHHDRALGRRYREAIEVGAHSGAQHDAGAVVVGKRQRPLGRAGSQHRALCHDAPAALARLKGRGRGEMIADPLHRAVGGAVVDAEDGRARHEANIRHGRKLGNGLLRPRRRRLAGNLQRFTEQAAAEAEILLRHDDARARAPAASAAISPAGPEPITSTSQCAHAFS